MIVVKELSRKYQMGTEEVNALRSITMDIRKNEYVALMGPSGSGKSTLMNMLGCLDTPTGGDYILNGKNVARMLDNELAEVRNSFLRSSSSVKARFTICWQSSKVPCTSSAVMFCPSVVNCNS